MIVADVSAYVRTASRMQPEIIMNTVPLRSPLARFLAVVVLGAAVAGSLVWIAAGPPARAQAQQEAPTAGAAPPVAVPSFWDPRRRPDRPDLSRVSVIRFLTETDYPPFNFA